MEKPTCHIVKIGGKLIDDPSHYNQFLKGFSSLNDHKILIHGGGKQGSDLLKKFKIEPRYHAGRRITDSDTLEILVMAYAGSLNKKVTADMQSQGIDAIGLSGCDLNLIQCAKRPSLPYDYGFAGDIEKINIEALNNLLKISAVPVICPITHDGKGQFLNTNADTIANAISIALAKDWEVHLHYCFELNGVLRDLHFPNSIIETISYADYLKMKENGDISSGMLPKLLNAFDAIQSGVKKVTIGNAGHFIGENLHTSLQA